MFNKILIANRGEIAVRIIRACREMGISTVAVYSDIDKDSLHVQLADETICIGPAKARDSYLKMDRILSAAISTGADAIHPGFGFLSESPKFAELCMKCNIVFIGPSARVIERMGNKQEARNTMIKARVPVVPGTTNPVNSAEEGLKIAKEIGYPLIIKASSGGGGKGMRIVHSSDKFISSFKTASQEARNAFGDDSLYIEKYIQNARHIEVQILADNYGNTVHLGERDCSIQRRHQKLIEEAPAYGISEELRKEMGLTAIKAAQSISYNNAGTVEFILDKDNRYYFIEMNTRLQVEHGVTEMVTGIDIVKEQILIASGNKLKIKQEDISIKGHAIECRINAESPRNNFLPYPGQVTNLHMPGGCGVRIDSALYHSYRIPSTYDSLIAKVLVHDESREEAIKKMRGALGEIIIEGIETNVDFLYDIMNDTDYCKGRINTGFVESFLDEARLEKIC
ncbi:MAG: acetyl-CoA carboxylase biotin carboxylase subunit [Clostridiales bacterium]|nr:acetyl-CoA carboxylase biotin carboxylase subunit [Clostridiales bacterium]